jgi:hypothetical protein
MRRATIAIAMRDALPALPAARVPFAICHLPSSFMWQVPSRLSVSHPSCSMSILFALPRLPIACALRLLLIACWQLLASY